jgi:choline dehydrogenase
VSYDVVVVGAGTAGCVLAARLSEESERTVCLLEAGPDYGPQDEGRWPADILDPRALAFSHDWGVGGQDNRSLGARIVGGSSAHNACMVIWGAPSDYDEWGEEWSFESLETYLRRATACMRTTGANTQQPAPPHDAFVEAARRAGFPLLDAPSDPERPTGVARLPANVVGGVRWSAAFSYLDPARARANLTVLDRTLVDSLVIDGRRCVAVQTAAGQRIEAATVVLAAGAYFSPAILMRSGIGPAGDLRELGIAPVVDLPVGERLLDHHGTSLAWEPTAALDETCVAHESSTGPLFQPNAFIKAASSRCAPGTWDLMLLSWITPPTGDAERYAFSISVFHMKPASHGRLRLRSVDPSELPMVDRGFFTDPADLPVVVEGIDLARTVASNDPLQRLLGTELRPGSRDLDEYARATARNYYHPAGTCAIGQVVDSSGRVLGLEGLVVADASVMPTIPRANTNVTVAALAEKLAETL